MMNIKSCIVSLLCGLALVGCSMEDEQQPVSRDQPAALMTSSMAASNRDYSSPPRCGPRNCVAMCVTCLYDICRASGGSISICKQSMELCKDDCFPGTCVPGEPGCPCTNPTDPACF
jgi:hypothetical protein